MPVSPLALISLFERRLHLREADVRLQDIELILTATEVQAMLGLEPAAIQMDRTLIRNRASLWELVGKGPGLQPVQLLATMRRRLKHETAAFDFDLVRLEVASAVLVQELSRSVKLDFRDMDFEGTLEKPGTVCGKLCLLLVKVLCEPAREKLREIARIFKRWLGQYGNVGCKKLPKRHSEAPTTTSVDPQVSKMIQDIVKRRGLLAGTFTLEQLSRLGDIEVTHTLEEEIRHTWAAHKTRRR